MQSPPPSHLSSPPLPSSKSSPALPPVPPSSHVALAAAKSPVAVGAAGSTAVAPVVSSYVPSSRSHSIIPCSHLQNGSTFAGVQGQLTEEGPLIDWTFTLHVHQVDYAAATISGVLMGYHATNMDEPLLTYIDGELIDDIHADFIGRKEEFKRESIKAEAKAWKKLGGFKKLWKQLRSHPSQPVHRSNPLNPYVPRHERHHAQPPLSLQTLYSSHAYSAALKKELRSGEYIFMRWKEGGFIGRQIERVGGDGVYYVALHRHTGEIEAIYWNDASSAQHQRHLVFVGYGLYNSGAHILCLCVLFLLFSPDCHLLLKPGFHATPVLPPERVCTGDEYGVDEEIEGVGAEENAVEGEGNEDAVVDGGAEDEEYAEDAGLYGGEEEDECEREVPLTTAAEVFAADEMAHYFPHMPEDISFPCYSFH